MNPREISRIVGGGLVALLIALILTALSMFGVINELIGHLCFFLSWVVCWLLITTEMLPGKPVRRKAGWIIVAGILLLAIDLLALRLKQPQLSNEVNVIFGGSPILTTERRVRIQGEITSFYGYLNSIGLKTPIETPPLHIGGLIDEGMVRTFDRPAYLERITISAEGIDDSINVIYWYSSYAFAKILHDKEGTADNENRNKAVGVIAEYFLWCYFGRRRDALVSNWNIALWDMRNELGDAFMTQTLVFTIRAMNDLRRNNAFFRDFDHYMFWYLVAGQLTMDGQPETLSRTRELLRRHGIQPSPF